MSKLYSKLCHNKSESVRKQYLGNVPLTQKTKKQSSTKKKIILL